QTYHRHQLPSREYYVYDYFRDADGNPLYPQRPTEFRADTGAGSIQSGKFKGKMIVVQMITDEIAYAWQADWYGSKVKAALGDRFGDNYRLWYIDNALHTPPVITPLDIPPAITTRMINYGGVLQQALRDVAAWAEKGVAPIESTTYKVVDGQVQVPPKASDRKGLQPVITVTANGGKRTEVKEGKKVKFEAVIEAPPDAGTIVDAEWDFEGEGDYPVVQKLKDTKSTRVNVKTTYTFSESGTYFPALRATLHRQGDPQTPYARVQNIGRVKVVVHEDEKRKGKKKSKDGKELILELEKLPIDLQNFMDRFVETVTQRTTVVQGVEISTIEIGPRTDRSTKFQLIPDSPIKTIYTVTLDDIDSGVGVFIELEIEVGGAYRLAKKTIQKAMSKSIAENTIEVINEILG
ncbi:MAG: PKD domain-containing protein, partial [Candidatus Thorarchaeota archaeon]